MQNPKVVGNVLDTTLKALTTQRNVRTGAGAAPKAEAGPPPATSDTVKVHVPAGNGHAEINGSIHKSQIQNFKTKYTDGQVIQ